MDEDKKNRADYMLKKLQDGYIVARVDYSQNIAARGNRETQKQYMGAILQFALLPAVVQFMSAGKVVKLYMYWSGEFQDHSPELATLAMSDIVTYVREKYPDVTVKGLVFDSDNCAKEWAAWERNVLFFHEFCFMMNNFMIFFSKK